jgi:SET domain-containing protein
MLKVKTFIASSNIHGLGVFAAHDIKRGTLIWEEGFERIFTEDEVNAMPPDIQNIIRIRGWKDTFDGLYRLSIDNDQFTNHSDDSNTMMMPDGTLVAKRDIVAGEEITNNYYEFDKGVQHKFNTK